MSFSRKVIRNAAKAELKKRGYSRPNKLAYHKGYGVDIYKMAIIHLYGRSRRSGRAKRRRHV